MSREIRRVIADAMHEAYRYDASGPNSEDILDALEKSGYAVVKLDELRELHHPLENSISAMYPEPQCSCNEDYPCPTAKAVGLT